MKPPDRALPTDLTIYAVGEWHGHCLAWVEQAEADSAELAVDASAVTEIDAAGVQLLVSLHRTLSHRGQQLRLQRPSTTLHRACMLLGAGVLVAEAAQPEVTA